MSDVPLFTFNKGKISDLAAARVDQNRVSLAAETMSNFIPRRLGPMSLRPGWQYITNSRTNTKSKYIPFVYSSSEKALLELQESSLRIIIDDVVLTRPAVSSSITNTTFTTDLTGWTDNDEAGDCVSEWASSVGGVPGTFMRLYGDGYGAAIRDQTVTVAAGDQGVEHALEIRVELGPVILRVGTSTTDDSYIEETVLYEGYHNLAFTPTGDFNIRFMNRERTEAAIDYCQLDGGDVVIPTVIAESDLPLIRWDQSGDIIFVAVSGRKNFIISRRDTRSWSSEAYYHADGPFFKDNKSAITMQFPGTERTSVINSSSEYFKSAHKDALMKLVVDGQRSVFVAKAEDRYTRGIKVEGVGVSRKISISITGTITATTITLQRSLISEIGPWHDVDGATWTASYTNSDYYDSNYDNITVWYRLAVKNGDYGGSDSVTMDISSTKGTTTAFFELRSYNSATQMDAILLNNVQILTSSPPTKEWAIGLWSSQSGFPSSVSFHDGRLWWAGNDYVAGSVSDGYYSFDPDFPGDAGPIVKTIGQGPVANINWLASLQRLILGGDLTEFSARASNDDGPMTPTDFVLRPSATEGSGNVNAVVIDQSVIYVQKSSTKIYQLSYGQRDYEPRDLTLLNPEIGEPGIVALAVQRQPDTRIHAVRSDGTVALGVIDAAENILAWVDITTDGTIEDVVVLPGTTEDQVYYSVQRTINGSTVRFLEKWALESECRGGTLNKQADAFVTYTGASTTTITGLSHLEGEEVVVWADSKDVGTQSDYTQTYTVSSGQITLATAASNVVVGLPYTAQWKASKGPMQPAALLNKKRITHLGLMMKWVHPKGLRFGPDFTNLDDLPEIEQGVAIDPDTIRTEYDEQSGLFPGVWDTNARLCLQAQAPRPVTILAAVGSVRRS